MPTEPLNLEKIIGVHQNFDYNEIRKVLMENTDYHTMPTPEQGTCKGLLYYDIVINHPMVWTGYVWKILKYADDKAYSYTEDVQVENIWVQSNLIPTNEEDAEQSNIVEKYSDIVMVYVEGSTSFQATTMVNVIPAKYADFYKPVLKTSTNLLIDDSKYKIEGDTVSFYEGFINDGDIVVNAQHPPKITFYRYIGRRGTFNFLGGYTDTLIFHPSTDPLNTFELLPGIENIDIVSVHINGKQEIDYSYSEENNLLTLNEEAMGYAIEYSADYPEDNYEIVVKYKLK